MSGFSGFGQGGNNNATFNFGAKPAGSSTQPPQATTGLFGATSNPAPTGTGNLFGGGSTTPASAPPAGSSLFGGTGGTSGGSGSLFGGAGTSNTANPPSTSSFTFGAAPSATPTAGAPPAGGSLFGATPANPSSTNPGTPAAKPLFGGFGQSTTPAAAPPASGSTNLFGAKPAGTSLFGNPSSSTPSGTATPTAAAPQTSLFGAKPADNSAQPSLFGAKPSTPGPGGLTPSAAGSTTPAGAPPVPSAMFSFGPKPTDQSAAAASTAKPPPPLFGGGTAAADPSKTNAPAAGTSGNLFGGGSLFGAKPADDSGPSGTANTSTTPAPGGFGLSLPKPAETAAKPAAGGFSFNMGGSGAGVGGPQAGTSTEPAKSTFSFGAPPAASTSTPAASSTTTPATTIEAPKSATGGFSFSLPTSSGTTTGDKSVPTKAPAAPGGFSFSAPADANKGKEADKAVPASEAPKSGSLFNLTGSNTAASSAQPATGSLFGSKPAGSSTTPAAPAQPAATSSSSAPAQAPAAQGTTTNEPAPNLLRGKTLEDIVEGWRRDLEVQVKEFERQAGEVREWDKVLMRNGNYIGSLHREILQAQQNQAAVDKALDYIEAQGKTLDSMLAHYEREINAYTTDSGKPLAAKLPADKEREKAYTLASDLNKQLDDLSRSLSQMIEEVNSLSASQPGQTSDETNGEDPIDQISAILGAHLRTLQTVDHNTASLEDQVVGLEARMGQEKGRFGLPELMRR